MVVSDSSTTQNSTGDHNVRALLSARQQEIMDLVARGLTNKEIARQLGLTDGTVKQHLAAIFPKLGVRNRTWAVSIWHQASPENTPLFFPSQRELTARTTDFVGDEVMLLPSRLLASVAVCFTASASCSSADSARLASKIIATCRLWAGVFEGGLRLGHPGCVMVMFGYPRAHLDDVSRATAFAETVRRELREYLGIDVRVGIDAGRDELWLSAGQLVRSETAWNSLALVTRGSEADHGIARTGRTIQLADAVHSKVPGAPDWASLSAAAPFINEAQRALEQGRASWFSIESWPPMPAKQLLDAWRHSALAATTRQIVLRMPANAEREQDVEYSLLNQLHAQLPGIGGAQQRDADLGWWLHSLAREGPLSVIVYGWNDTVSFTSLLGDAALDELASCPIIFLLGLLPIVGNPRLVVRSLDAKGRKPLIGRVHEIALAEPDSGMDGHNPDIVALLDQVDEVSRAVLGLVLKYRRCTAGFLAHQLETHGAELEQRLVRLGRLGLVSLWPDGSVRMRDERTKRTISEQLRSITKVI